MVGNRLLKGREREEEKLRVIHRVLDDVIHKQQWRVYEIGGGEDKTGSDPFSSIRILGKTYWAGSDQSRAYLRF